ncbi:hypothetical protein RhiirA1_451593 [Rhizophagus irregularis]|uniref:Uncharacterized protein n=1 Tax=Rhizophagus irregularis TaxID=588596 RepID=A0A2N0SBZ9_9GLOM|nr:hypothetical protein RhiirA1_451593 [Rhizophagus irregularis]
MEYNQRNNTSERQQFPYIKNFELNVIVKLSSLSSLLYNFDNLRYKNYSGVHHLCGIECWKFEPSERPNIQNIVSILKGLNFSTNEKIQQNMNLNLIIVNESKSELTELSTDIFDLVSNKINNIIIDEFIAHLINKHDKDFTFGNIKQLINQHLLQLSQTTDKIIKWLSKNQDKDTIYYFNIVIENDFNFKDFKLFLKAANENFPIAQVYLAKCYYNGYGTEINYNLPFNWCS